MRKVRLPALVVLLAARLAFAAQVPHSPVRVYVMGKRGIAREPALPEDMSRMAEIVREGIDAGALGFATSRTVFHRSATGEIAPTETVGEGDLRVIFEELRRLGKGVVQCNGPRRRPQVRRSRRR